ncbi:hypothetical protein Leryth_020655 [Lithospermum erythrorhizon]|nr:hypothetical protein Leryth_020655 [Lithospermum erythrorhizon]
MFRALSTRPNRNEYKELDEIQPTSSSSDPKFTRSTSVPDGKISGQSETNKKPNILHEKQANKVAKLHPIFALFSSTKRSKKATTKPEFQRIASGQDLEELLV